MKTIDGFNIKITDIEPGDIVYYKVPEYPYKGKKSSREFVRNGLVIKVIHGMIYVVSPPAVLGIGRIIRLDKKPKKEIRMGTKIFSCTNCKKSFEIPSFRWAPDRGADFFSADWEEKDMLKHNLCGECSDRVRECIENMNFPQVKINFCHDYDDKWKDCINGEAITSVDRRGQLCYLKECGNIEECKYKNTLRHIPNSPVYMAFPVKDNMNDKKKKTTKIKTPTEKREEPGK